MRDVVYLLAKLYVDTPACQVVAPPTGIAPLALPGSVLLTAGKSRWV